MEFLPDCGHAVPRESGETMSRRAVGAKSSAKFTVAFDQLTNACNTCHAGANKPFIRIQRPTARISLIVSGDFARW